MFKTLNLAYPEKSQIKFHISKFPDGQQTIDIDDVEQLNSENIKIYSRIRSFRDLEIIIAANQILRTAAVASVSLYAPYFLGARSDRRFKKGGTNYLKNVIAPIINSQNFDCVLVLDPHSDVLEATLNNFEKISNSPVVKSALDVIGKDNVILVSPDGGALKKIYDVAEEFDIPNIITAMKHRDIHTGKITHTEVPLSEARYYKDSKFVIVDDICDGGRTFIELAKAIREKVADAKIYLVVTHGLFTSGFDQLNIYFEKVFTTNSYADVSISETNAEGNSGYGTYDFNGFAQSGSIARTDLLTQLNVF
jgi:ribose-phosphate pyrophosphokinase